MHHAIRDAISICDGMFKRRSIILHLLQLHTTESILAVAVDLKDWNQVAEVLRPLPIKRLYNAHISYVKYD